MTTNAKSWKKTRRDDQKPPKGDWKVWLFSGGRGSGKTRLGSEEIIRRAEKNPGSRFLIVTRTYVDIRENIVGGESGIMSSYRRLGRENDAPEHRASIRRLIWPNGSQAVLYSAEDFPEDTELTVDFIWIEGVGGWDSKKSSTWDSIFRMIQNTNTRTLITTTPEKTPMLAYATLDLLGLRDRVVFTQANTLRNTTLLPLYIQALLAKARSLGLYRSLVAGEWPWRVWND